ncbi:MAG: class I SAM-dependent methyltransferase [Anaerolineae bacterium]|jgi:SAM-dependent methyltransferase|nr:class I SAM-dependent methyltransferase [Anaerolineae bacterium]
MRPTPVVTALEHYERLIDEGNDPCEDTPWLQSYMARWDGPQFFEMLGDLTGKAVLEVGVGTGRLARQALQRGCLSFTGIDLSPKTIERARLNLGGFPNAELLLADAEAFARPAAYDAAYSVLTLMHIADKRHALQAIVTSLRLGGVVVLSIDHGGPWLDFGDRMVRLYPATVDAYVGWLTDLGCQTHRPVPLIDTWVGPQGAVAETYGKPVASLVRAVKRG